MPQLEMTLDEYHNLTRGKASKPAGRRGGPSPEHLIQNSILSYLAMLPHVYAWRVNSGRVKTEKGALIQLAPAGTADIIGYVSVASPAAPGSTVAVFMALEIKTAKNDATPLQQAYLDGVTRAGGFAMVARSVTEVQEALEAFVAKIERR